jgi:hypothetical protein
MIDEDGLIGVDREHRSSPHSARVRGVCGATVLHQPPEQDVREFQMAATVTAPATDKGRRIVGAERATLAKDLVKRYTSGESIRALASSTGRSYGFVHRVLTESGVQLRQRGGARRRKKAA